MNNFTESLKKMVNAGVKTAPAKGQEGKLTKQFLNSFDDEATKNFGIDLMDGKNVKIFPLDD